MKRGPESLGHELDIDAEWRHDRRKGLESAAQLRSTSSFREPQIRRKDEHGLVNRRMTSCKGEIGQRNILDCVSAGRSVCRVPKRPRDLAKAFERNCGDNRIPVFKMGVENGLTMLDLVGQATDRNGAPSFALRDRASCGDDTLLALGSLPVFSFSNSQHRSPEKRRALIDQRYRYL